MQLALGAALGVGFRPKPIDEVHATILGLEGAPGCAHDIARFIGAALRRAPLELQFGGFPEGETALRSRGRSLHERSAVLGGGLAVVIGWPVENGQPTARLGELRVECAQFGVIHKYQRGTTALDPDAYMVIGGINRELGTAAVAEAERVVRAAALDRRTRVRLTAAEVSLVRYTDPALPRASSSWRRVDG